MKKKKLSMQLRVWNRYKNLSLQTKKRISLIMEKATNALN